MKINPPILFFCNVVQLSDNAGAVTKTYTYDAFGNETNPDPADENPLRYAGEQYDAETGTYYLRARYYDPATSRMLSEDTHWNPANMVYNSNGDVSLSAIRQSSNLYVYCTNNPLNFIDPTGLWTIALGVDASAAFLIRLGVSGQIVIDGEGNIGLILSGAVGGGTPQASVSAVGAITNADTIFDLEGVGFQVGGSVLVAGVEAIGGTAQDGTPVMGILVSAGVSLFPVEGHGEISVTGVISLNWLKELFGTDINNSIENYYNSLDDDTKALVKDYGISFD